MTPSRSGAWRCSRARCSPARAATAPRRPATTGAPSPTRRGTGTARRTPGSPGDGASSDASPAGDGAKTSRPTNSSSSGGNLPQCALHRGQLSREAASADLVAQEVFPGAATDVHDTLHYPMLDGTLHVEPTTMEQIRGVRSRAQRRLMRDVLQGDKYRSWVESRPQALDAFLATLHDPHVRGRFGAWAVVDHGEKVRRLYAQRGRILFVAERARPTQPVCGTLLLDSGGGLLEYQFNGFAGGGHASADLMAERSAALELALVQTRASTGSHASTSGTRAPSSTTASSPTSVAWGAPSSRCAGRRPSASTSVRRGVSRSSPGTRCSPARRARGRRCSATTTRRRRARREVPQERQGGEERDEEYGRALVCVLPYTGGFAGYPATLAMASGVPVIATRRAGLPEHLGDAGVWAAPDDPEGLAAAITRLLRDDAERRRVAEAGRARAEHALSWDAVARSTMACYEKAVRFKHATAA